MQKNTDTTIHQEAFEITALHMQPTGALVSYYGIPFNNYIRSDYWERKVMFTQSTNSDNPWSIMDVIKNSFRHKKKTRSPYGLPRSNLKSDKFGSLLYGCYCAGTSLVSFTFSYTTIKKDNNKLSMYPLSLWYIPDDRPAVDMFCPCCQVGHLSRTHVFPAQLIST